MVCNENECNFHFVKLESENEHYTDKDVCKVKIRELRFASFVCDKCGLLKKVEVVNGWESD